MKAKKEKLIAFETKFLPVPQKIKRRFFRLELRRLERPFINDLDQELNWLCSSLGFCGKEEASKLKENTASKVFKEIIKASSQGTALTSTTLARKVGLSRGAIINQLNNLQAAGLIEKHGRYYEARSKSVKRIITELEKDVERIFSEMKKVAQCIDTEFSSD